MADALAKEGHEHRGDQKTEHELWEASPDFRRTWTMINTNRLPTRRSDDRQQDCPNANLTSRPTTFISVKAATARSASPSGAPGRCAAIAPYDCAAAVPAASANSDLPIQAPPTPAGKCRGDAAKGKARTMTIAQTTTIEINTPASCFSAPTATATAIAPTHRRQLRRHRVRPRTAVRSRARARHRR